MEERRTGVDELKRQIQMVSGKVDHLQGYLESEFGGKGLSGQPTEGNIIRRFRDINTEICEQDKRIAKLEDRTKIIEDWKMYILGGVGACGIVFSLVTLLVQVVKK